MWVPLSIKMSSDENFNGFIEPKILIFVGQRSSFPFIGLKKNPEGTITNLVLNQVYWCCNCWCHCLSNTQDTLAVSSQHAQGHLSVESTLVVSSPQQCQGFLYGVSLALQQFPKRHGFLAVPSPQKCTSYLGNTPQHAKGHLGDMSISLKH